MFEFCVCGGRRGRIGQAVVKCLYRYVCSLCNVLNRRCKYVKHVEKLNALNVEETRPPISSNKDEKSASTGGSGQPAINQKSNLPPSQRPPTRTPH